jgi:hypothetical protein
MTATALHEQFLYSELTPSCYSRSTNSAEQRDPYKMQSAQGLCLVTMIGTSLGQVARVSRRESGNYGDRIAWLAPITLCQRQYARQLSVPRGDTFAFACFGYLRFHASDDLYALAQSPEDEVTVRSG